LSAFSFPLLLERARERRFKTDNDIQTVYMHEDCAGFEEFQRIVVRVTTNVPRWTVQTWADTRPASTARIFSP
jgi:hypothetical protein